MVYKSPNLLLHLKWSVKLLKNLQAEILTKEQYKNWEITKTKGTEKPVWKWLRERARSNNPRDTVTQYRTRTTQQVSRLHHHRRYPTPQHRPHRSSLSQNRPPLSLLKSENTQLFQWKERIRKQISLARKALPRQRRRGFSFKGLK